MFHHKLLSRTTAALALVLTLQGGFTASANSLVPGTLAQDAPGAAGIHIVVLEGEKAVNVIKKKTSVPPVVQVLDSHDQPVTGAAVTFTAPDQGASVIFNNSKSATVITEADGKATPPHVTVTGEGDFQYQVTAVFHDQKAAATINQSNVLSGSDSANAGTTGATGATAQPSHKLWWIVGGVAAAAAVGVGVSLAGHTSSGTASTTPTAVIGVGTGAGSTAGAPH